MQWSAETREKYGSVIDFIVQIRLKWESLPDMNPETGSLFKLDNPVPFKSSKDWKVLLNDWPYGFEPGIVHMIVWLKHRLETEPVLGDLTLAARLQVQDFIEKTFQRDIDNLPGTSDRIVWFKNWTALQTVPGIDHIHVLVRDIPQSMLQKWLNA
ncbi:hypothetical protein BT93_L5513 [Corymbia citriodora subsp. variegata]|uniref:N-acetylglucosamine-induced protein 1 n=1 Tax=Corymbia citriodora subsp. variegata TaxID=360336 RepID=A0A8T0CJQ9_CORYI|nr:hypothetical protein BT93_L5513 [Corymbia citriodora subsp. variegata]